MLSLVIPVYNEAESLDQLVKEIHDVAREQGYDAEIIFVDDGSTDASWAKIDALARHDARIRGLRFRRNFGKAAALNAGFRAVRGEFVMTLDADLQDDPREIPNFLAQMAAGKDVVSGWKQVRHDPWHKVLPSRVFNGMVSWLTGVWLHDHNCGMKCYRRAVLDEVNLYGELHRFVPVLAASRGFHVGEQVVQHRARQFGYSKFGFERFVKGFLDLLTVKFLTHYGRRPLHLFGTMALIFFVWGIAQGIAFPSPFGLYFWVLMATLFMLAGLLAELIVSTRGRESVPYSISELTQNADPGWVDHHRHDTDHHRGNGAKNGDRAASDTPGSNP